MPDPAPACVGFLHTAEVHRATFEALVADRASGVGVSTVVDPDLLAWAQADPADERVVVGIDRALGELAACSTVVCTCSTIGDLAERRGEALGVNVARVDRAMAERAAASPRPVVAVVAVASTIEPTRGLLASVGIPDAELVVAAGAWALFEAGDLDGYLDAIEDAAVEAAGRAGVVVLAQASMAAVAERLGGELVVDGRIVAVLASPGLAVEAALASSGVAA